MDIFGRLLFCPPHPPRVRQWGCRVKKQTRVPCSYGADTLPGERDGKCPAVWGGDKCCVSRKGQAVLLYSDESDRVIRDRVSEDSPVCRDLGEVREVLGEPFQAEEEQVQRSSGRTSARSSRVSGYQENPGSTLTQHCPLLGCGQIPSLLHPAFPSGRSKVGPDGHPPR